MLWVMNWIFFNIVWEMQEERQWLCLIIGLCLFECSLCWDQGLGFSQITAEHAHASTPQNVFSEMLATLLFNLHNQEQR